MTRVIRVDKTEAILLKLEKDLIEKAGRRVPAGIERIFVGHLNRPTMLNQITGVFATFHGVPGGINIERFYNDHGKDGLAGTLLDVDANALSTDEEAVLDRLTAGISINPILAVRRIR